MPVVVVIGVGGIGLAVARRLGGGKRLVLADSSYDTLWSAASTLGFENFDIALKIVDVTDAADVHSLAECARSNGDVETVISTVGVSPARASADQVYDVNLVGHVHVLDAFQNVISPGGSLTSIASNVARYITLPADDNHHLARCPATSLRKSITKSLAGNTSDSNRAYSISKYANVVRTRAAAVAYGARGVRINTVSPGFIPSPMDLYRPPQEPISAALARHTIGATTLPREGTVDDVANAVAFLASPEAGFITGTDLLVDGGAMVTPRWTNWNHQT